MGRLLTAKENVDERKYDAGAGIRLLNPHLWTRWSAVNADYLEQIGISSIFP